MNKTGTLCFMAYPGINSCLIVAEGIMLKDDQYDYEQFTYNIRLDR